jgi:hypothetical protein
LIVHVSYGPVRQQLIRIPSVPNYSGVRKLIENATSAWMEEFLAREGLVLLFSSLEKLSSTITGGRGGGFSNALLQLEVVYAVRAVVNSKVGLEYLLSQRQLTRQLVQGNLLSPDIDAISRLSPVAIHFPFVVGQLWPPRTL